MFVLECAGPPRIQYVPSMNRLDLAGLMRGNRFSQELSGKDLR